MSKYNLDRFIDTQRLDHAKALAEIKAGKKKSHYMWYIFPQLMIFPPEYVSSTSRMFAISGLEEAREYIAHPFLRANITELCEALLVHTDKTADNIFGVTDAKKLKSCMTLFALVSEENSIFHKVLDLFYQGEMDDLTLDVLRASGEL